MAKVFVVLNDEDQLTLERICADKEEDEALVFVLKSIVPKLHKTIPCMAGELMRHEG